MGIWFFFLFKKCLVNTDSKNVVRGKLVVVTPGQVILHGLGEIKAGIVMIDYFAILVVHWMNAARLESGQHAVRLLRAPLLGNPGPEMVNVIQFGWTDPVRRSESS